MSTGSLTDTVMVRLFHTSFIQVSQYRHHGSNATYSCYNKYDNDDIMMTYYGYGKSSGLAACSVCTRARVIYEADIATDGETATV